MILEAIPTQIMLRFCSVWGPFAVLHCRGMVGVVADKIKVEFHKIPWCQQKVLLTSGSQRSLNWVPGAAMADPTAKDQAAVTD